MTTRFRSGMMRISSPIGCDERFGPALYYIREGYAIESSVRVNKLMAEWKRAGCTELCPEYMERLIRTVEAVLENQKTLKLLTNQYDVPFKPPPRPYDPRYIESVDAIIDSLAREWSAEAAADRQQVYGWILEQLEKHVPKESMVLVPGVSCGRLMWEILRAGYAFVEGNDVVTFPLLPMTTIFEGLDHQMPSYPNCMRFSNVYKGSDQLKRVMIPDVFPARHIGHTRGQYRIVAGDFDNSYKFHEEDFEAVAGAFFLDLTTGLIGYLQTIHRILRPDGLFIHVGSLTFMGESFGDPQVLLTWEELKLIMGRMGFELVTEDKIETNFLGNPRSLRRLVNVCVRAVWRVKKESSLW